MSDLTIPIENIYYMFCYAWDKLEERDIVSLEPIEGSDFYDLFGKVLSSGVNYILRKGLDRGYLDFQEATNTIRGKIDFSTSIKKNLVNSPKLFCNFDDLDFNTTHNRIVKSTMKFLLQKVNIDEVIKEDLHNSYRRFPKVDEIELNRYNFNNVKLNSNIYFYDFLLKICEMIMENYFISEATGESKFRDLIQDEKKMWRLFQDFVRNFYIREQNRYKVTHKKIYWAMNTIHERDIDYLPSMDPDMMLVASDRKIILDTKYYTETLSSRFGREKIHADNLYQIVSYLMNIESEQDDGIIYEGLLLYPTVEREYNLSYEIRGHKLSIRTINLNQHWKQIHEDLIDIIN